MRKYTILIVFLLALSVQAAGAPQAKYVFLLIGDGMGASQRAAAEVALNAGGGGGRKQIHMNRMPVFGMTTTHAKGAEITDSAAAGTAIACGTKVQGGVVAVDGAGKQLASIASAAKQRGMKVGIISSVSLDHATPACFYAHARNRGDYYNIAVQAANSEVDYFGGGGLRAALYKNVTATQDMNRPSPFAIAEKNGFTIVRSREAFEACRPDQRVWAVDPVLDKDAAMPYELDRSDESPSLADYTRKGIELLENPRGFFMMVEGGKIDWACHINDAGSCIADTLAFDAAVKVALDFQAEHPADTLVVVTGDHETGGMALGTSATKYKLYPDRLNRQTMSALAFSQVIAGHRKKKTPFKEVLPLIEKTFGFAKLSRDETAGLKADYEKPQTLMDPLVGRCLKLFSRRAGIGWTSITHTATPVPISAAGAGAETFGGYYDNTEIFSKLLAVLPAE